jgi:hypothetical protein
MRLYLEGESAKVAVLRHQDTPAICRIPQDGVVRDSLVRHARRVRREHVNTTAPQLLGDGAYYMLIKEVA